MRSAAANHRRRVIRQLGVSVGELDPVARGYLDVYVRCIAKVGLYDAWIAEHGLIDEQGNQPGFMTAYFAAANSARLALAKLDDRLAATTHRDSGLDALLAEGHRVTEARQTRVIDQ